MEKNYAERVMEIKNEILKEIRELLPDGETHKFENTFYVHYVSGEVATTEVCKEVKNDCGSIGFKVIPDDSFGYETTEFVDGEDIFNFEPNTFMDVLENLRKELREKKLAKLREIVKNAGGRIKFDGKFDFFIYTWGEDYVCNLDEISINSCGKLEVKDRCDGDKCENCEDEISNTGLDDLIDYVSEHSKRKFVVRVSGSFSRTFEIEASSYEEALEFAKTEWKEDAPLCPDDSDGENWF